MQDSRTGNLAPGTPARRGRLIAWGYRALTAAVLAFVGWRLLPHLGAVTGLGDGPGAAPRLAVTALDGTPYGPATLRGRVVLVNAWATWCLPCRAEMPVLQAMADRHRARGLVVLGLSLDTLPTGPLADWVAARGVRFPIARADAATLAALGYGGAVPTSWLLDRDGRVRHRVIGPIGAVSLELAVRRLLDE